MGNLKSVFNSIVHTYFRLSTLSQKKTNWLQLLYCSLTVSLLLLDVSCYRHSPITAYGARYISACIDHQSAIRRTFFGTHCICEVKQQPTVTQENMPRCYYSLSIFSTSCLTFRTWIWMYLWEYFPIRNWVFPGTKRFSEWTLVIFICNVIKHCLIAVINVKMLLGL